MRVVLQKSQSLWPALLLLLTWEAGARLGWFNSFLLPGPSVVAKALWEMGLEGQLWSDVGQSLGRVLLGFTAAAIIGTPLGLWMGLSPRAERMLGPLVQILRPIPPIAWIPLAILWFGLGGGASYFLTMIGAFFPIVLNTHLGVTSISDQHRMVARSFEASRRKTFLRVIVPASLPYIMAGYRIGFGVAWMSLVGAEMLAVQGGLGYLIHVSQDLLKTDRVIGGMLMIGLIGLFFDLAMRRLERRWNPWFGATV